MQNKILQNSNKFVAFVLDMQRFKRLSYCIPEEYPVYWRKKEAIFYDSDDLENGMGYFHPSFSVIATAL